MFFLIVKVIIGFVFTNQGQLIIDQLGGAMVASRGHYLWLINKKVEVLIKIASMYGVYGDHLYLPVKDF